MPSGHESNWHNLLMSQSALLAYHVHKSGPKTLVIIIITINTRSFPTDQYNECSGIYLNTVDQFNLADLK